MDLLPTVDFFGHTVTRLICGGNPLSGYSHVSDALDREMIEYYTMPKLQDLLNECWANGINTIQSRGDRHQMRMMLEHQLSGGKVQWIAQTASEFADIGSNIAEIARYHPIAIYHHGTHTDNSWHMGKMGAVHDVVKAIHDKGLPAGIGTHIPEVIEYVEDRGWEVDYYMGCFYNLARQYKSAPATDQDAYAKDKFPREDPARMTQVMRQVDKPCIGFKLMAASRNCDTPKDVCQAFRYAFDHIKPTDMVDVGMFQKYKNQVAINASYVRELLAS
ncbi:MAG: hypothetical protein V1800_06880 [Candidatus Latescibacterota bacterium]